MNVKELKEFLKHMSDETEIRCLKYKIDDNGNFYAVLDEMTCEDIYLNTHSMKIEIGI